MIHKRGILAIRFLALFVALCSATLPLELGGGITLESKEAWERGIAPIMVLSALFLLALTFMYKKATWVRWAFTFWLPLNFLVIALATWSIRPIPVNESLAIGAPVLLFWFWCSYKLFWSNNSNESIA